MAGAREVVARDEEPRIFQPRDVFRDHYVVESFIGAGASGQVYVVRHRFTQDRFALKVGHPKDRGDVKKAERSLAEARATYRIRHRNVVRIVDLASEADGTVWQLMELLQGLTVLALLDRCGKLSPLYAIDVAMEVAFGLQAAHEQQVVHRDVQPSNIFVTTDGEVKVLDFSLAKVIFADVRTTGGRPAVGTTGYMAPEQQGGAPASPQFDVYALGATLWQMLVGRAPFQGPADGAVDVAARQLRGPESLVGAAGLPAYCDEVLRRAMAADPGERYPRMWEMAQALRALRDRLAADPDAAALVRPSAWERRFPVVRDPEGWNQYRPPGSLPRGEPAPRVPSRRVVVPDTEPEERRSSGIVARTVPMATVSSRPPPTERTRRTPPSRRRRWIVLFAGVALAALAAGVAAGLGVAGISIGISAPTSSTKVPGPPTSSGPARRPSPPRAR